MKPTPTDVNVLAALQRIRRLRILMWGDLLALYPLGFIASILHAPRWLTTPAAIVWFGFFVIFGIAHQRARCPVCNHLFNIRVDWYGNPFTRKCLNCGLPLKNNEC